MHSPVVVDRRIFAVSIVNGLSAAMGGGVACFLGAMFAEDLGGVTVMVMLIGVSLLMLANAIVGVPWRARVTDVGGVEMSTLAGALFRRPCACLQNGAPAEEIEALVQVCLRRLERGPSFGYLGCRFRWVWAAEDEFVKQVSEWASGRN